MTRPGMKVSVQIAWVAYTTVTPGVVVHESPRGDEGFGPWVVCHAPTGRVIAYAEGDEHAQAIAAAIAPFDWIGVDYTDEEALAALGQARPLIADAGGSRFPSWDDV